MDEILLVDKPAGMTSFGVVARIRRKLTEAARQEWDAKYGNLTEEEKKHAPARPKKVKVGHAGTLDPFATGLLIVLVGKATKKAQGFLKLDKEYEALIVLGQKSTTGDPEGEISEVEDVKVPTLQAVEACARGMVGEMMQRVPEYSAVKINGQRAYKLARAGKQVEMPVRKVRIDEIEVLGYEWPELRIRCKVSSGTYIRALGEEMGERLMTGAYVKELRRTQVGQWRVEEAEKLGVDWGSNL